MKAGANNSLALSIYDEIGGWGITGSDFKRALDGYENVSEINLSLHSPGGSVFDGLAIYNQLKNHPATVNVMVDGLAASIASVIAMAGDSITIPENAFFMIHKPFMSTQGNADAFRDSADLLDKVETTLLAAYRDKTGLPYNELSEMLAAETWLTGIEAVAMGFADQIAEPISVAASFTSEINLRLPAMLKKDKDGNPIVENTTVAEPIAAAPITPAPVAEPVAAAPSVADFQAAEKVRRTEIRATFSGFEDFASLENACLDDMGITADAAGKQLLAAIGASKTPSAAQIHVGNGAIVRDGIRNSLGARLGSDVIDKGNIYAGYSLMELARASLSENGFGTAGMDKLTLVGNAFTHSSGDFSIALSDVAHKSMLKGYEEVVETFEGWTTKGSLSDFRVSNRVDMSRFPSLTKVAEGAEFQYVTTSDRAESIMLATYGKLFSITRQAIINDDLNVFTKVPQMFGRAAKRTIGDMVYAVLTANAKMSDNKALFHTDHNNISGGAFDIAALDAMKVAMMTQKEGDASLGIRPATLLTPVAQESTAKALLGAEFDPAFQNANVPNPVRGMVDVVAESRLDDASATTSYMVAASGQYDTVEVAYLDGNESPFLDQQGGFNVDGITHKVRIDAGVAPLSFRTFQRHIVS